MSYKKWTKEQLIANGKRLAELIPLVKKEMYTKKLTGREAMDYIISVEKAELTLEELRNEYKRR